MSETRVIPKTWLVGRAGDLSYLTYIEKIKGDGTEVINSRVSWEGWRDKKKPILRFENVPTAGWKIDLGFNKRYGQSNRKLFRVIEPHHGTTFELDVADFVKILQDIHIINGVIQGKYVLDKDRALVPESQYNALTQITREKVNAKTIKEGDLVETTSGNGVYLGVYSRFKSYHTYSNDISTERTKHEVKHFFFIPSHKEPGQKNETYDFVHELSSISNLNRIGRAPDLIEKGHKLAVSKTYGGIVWKGNKFEKDKLIVEFIPYDYCNDYAKKGDEIWHYVETEYVHWPKRKQFNTYARVTIDPETLELKVDNKQTIRLEIKESNRQDKDWFHDKSYSPVQLNIRRKK